jgi:hypothetical protein
VNRKTGHQAFLYIRKNKYTFFLYHEKREREERKFSGIVKAQVR